MNLLKILGREELQVVGKVVDAPGHEVWFPKTQLRNFLTVTDFGEGDSGIRRGRRKPGDFGASCHGSGVC